ncbi:hypothetical protein HY605_02455 [Candidatus Peregrinibacteria bacterium]|nr:hypothetical protein [Candidatus Peregrinibacteria bacterium]
MSKLIIKRRIDYPLFGLWKWKDPDYNLPLVIPVSAAKAYFYLKKDKYVEIRDLVVFVQGHIEIEFDPAPTNIVTGLKTKTGKSEAAHRIYSAYEEAMKKLEALLLSAANQKYLFWVRIISENEFFGRDGILDRDIVHWSLDGSDFQQFTPTIASPRGKNPMFKADQVITFAKWKKLQEAANNQQFLEDDLLELYRIRNKAHMRQAKTATIEASIISETLLREYGLKALETQGFSKKRIKKIKDDLTFNNLLNVVLPLSLPRSEFNRISDSVQKVDLLRRIRNDLVHGNIQENEVDHNNVIEGTEAAIKLVNFLIKKINKES